jgi:hypothetical protein
MIGRRKDQILAIHIEVFGFERRIRHRGWILIHGSILA